MNHNAIGASDQKLPEIGGSAEGCHRTHGHVVRGLGKSLCLSEREPALISHDLRVTWGAGREERGLEEKKIMEICKSTPWLSVGMDLIPRTWRADVTLFLCIFAVLA